jgi:hypothetical protein
MPTTTRPSTRSKTRSQLAAERWVEGPAVVSRRSRAASHRSAAASTSSVRRTRSRPRSTRTVKARLDGLEAQRADLTAIAKTRALIEQLNAMISTQFRSTFTALETAFDARFRQLFGGGFARLSLTDPEDLAATGIEIVARPPGKKDAAAEHAVGR